mgnify:CR=1 FL=1
MKIFSHNKKLNALSFDTDITQCSKSCELYQSGLIPYCKQSLDRLFFSPFAFRLKRNNRKIKLTNFEKLANEELRQLRPNENLIRLYSFGDLSSVQDLEKWIRISKMNKNKLFWLSTRQDSILFEYLEQLGGVIPQNLTIRYSLPLIDTPKFLDEFLKKYGIVKSQIVDKKIKSNCQASKDNKNRGCRDCFKCWTKADLINYFNHGNMKYRLKDYLRFFR